MPIERFGVSMNRELLGCFDRQRRRRGYRSRSEAIRDLVRDDLVEQQWQTGKGEVVGTVTIVYDHQSRELDHLLTEMQHSDQQAVLCSTHVHLDRRNCLEVVVVRGAPGRVRLMADRLISARGVKHGRLVCTTTGKGLA
jgi:CopG family nickel-responsive transcriptional regulator